MAVGAINLIHYTITGEITKGNTYQRSSNLANALFAVAANKGNPSITKFAGNIAIGVAIATGFAHLKGLGKHHESGIRNI